MSSVWDNDSFAQAWNDTYGLDMAKAPIRPGLIYPLIAESIGAATGLRLIDFGCGNGNLIRHFKDRPFQHWLGLDGGSAILKTALDLKEDDSRIDFARADLSAPLVKPLTGFDVATAIFVVEEIPVAGVQAFFNTIATSIKPETGRAHIFTQHPSYAFKEDLLAAQASQPNTKFEGHQGYFDTAPTTYALSIMNEANNHPERASYHHKPMSVILNAISAAGLHPEVMGEIPSGVITLDNWRNHKPQCGDTPRFLYLQLRRL